MGSASSTPHRPWHCSLVPLPLFLPSTSFSCLLPHPPQPCRQPPHHIGCGGAFRQPRRLLKKHSTHMTGHITPHFKARDIIYTYHFYTVKSILDSTNLSALLGHMVTTSIPWLLIHWLLASQCHLQATSSHIKSYSEVCNKLTVFTINVGLSFDPAWSLLLLESTTINSADSNMSASLDIGTYNPVGSYIKFQNLWGWYLNSSRFFNSGFHSKRSGKCDQE